ncbi:hypothetical protein D9756_009587 [Leucocoprinus leucothites]|uniref:Uncharacterized protein n=1 Tax=Leucocoprinus leucothites TaxID=201217 RepID=A0A8H5CWQ3_9AGAR|nr:hypothetical protein D9756_009587 [Leucoagaricus leucothites]
MEQTPSTPPGIVRSATLDSSKSFDYTYTQDDGIKESFLVFSSKIYDLDKQLGNFANECLKLGRVAGLLLAIKRSRELLRRTREVFFRNACALLPELYELARKERSIVLREINSEQYHIPLQYFKNAPPPFDALPNVLEELAQSLSILHVRIAEFREFTDEGLFLRSLLLTMEHDLMYRASCARVYSVRLNTPPIQRYIHQFTDELERDFEKAASAVAEFTAVGVSAISHEQERSSQSLTNILTVATFFSGVTAGTLGMSIGTDSGGFLVQISSMLWYASLVFSVGAALNSLLAMAWKETRSGSRGGKMPFWVTIWIDGSQLLFLGLAIVTFSAGLVVFAFATNEENQPPFTPWITVGATGITFIGLIAVLIWLTYEISISPAFVQEAKLIKSGAESIHSNASKLPMLGGGLSGALSNTLVSLGLPSFSRGDPGMDVEVPAEKESPAEEFPKHDEGRDPPSNTSKAKLWQTRATQVGMLGAVTSAFTSAGNQRKRRHHMKSLSTRKLQIDTSLPSSPMTQLNLPTDPAASIELSRYGRIQDIAYSHDGTWLAVTCAKENTGTWTTVYDSQTLETYADTWHEGKVMSERLIWSPSGKKLIIKFEHRFDVWDLDAKVLHAIERHHTVRDIQWYGDEGKFSRNLEGIMMVYRFENMHIRSIGLEAKNNYLFVVSRVTKSVPEQIEPARSRAEKRIVIYDLDKEAVIYKVPVLEDISNIYPISGELDILVTHADHKAFQLWFIDAGIRGAEITARLKKRAITPQPGPVDYVGPTCIAGNYNQFILSVTSSGAIDFWRRESGIPYQRFEHQLLKEEGVRCFSWRKSSENTATFASSGFDGDILHIWRGEEPVVTKTPSSFELTRSPSSRGSVQGATRGLWQHAKQLTTGSSSGPMLPGEMNRVEESPEDA